ncbi:MAG TPA: hypothetical protein VJ810_28190 [Blastocatellia bacterium]|nr:hypothetical protein [Blastocatellia bacterium]
MNKPNYLYGIIGLLVGLFIGYVGTNQINSAFRPAEKNANLAENSNALPPDHPPTGGSSGDAASSSSGTTGTTMSGRSGSPSGGSSAVSWTAPTRWEAKPASGMRAATYIIPAASGDSEGAECAVFENLGGGVQDNISRWVGQFEKTDQPPTQRQETINNLSVTTVDVSGTFKGGGPMMGSSSGSKTGYRLLGAIAEGPGGDVFFKLTGPAKTIAAAQDDFRAMLKSIKKSK